MHECTYGNSSSQDNISLSPTQNDHSMISWFMERENKEYDFLREWYKNNIEEELLVSSSGSSEDEDN